MAIGFRKASCVAGGIAGLTLLTGAAALALPDPTPRSGVVEGKITVNFAAAPDAGSRVFCSVSLVSDDTRGPSESRSVDVAVKGKQAVCTVRVRYHWLLSKTDSTIQLIYSVSGPSQSSTGVYDRIPVPPDGKKTTFAVTLDQ